MRELVKAMYPENEFDEHEEELLNALNSLPLENQYQNALQWKVITKNEPTLTEGKNISPPKRKSEKTVHYAEILKGIMNAKNYKICY